MEVKSLQELRQADERTLKFNPVGLGGRMRPEDSAEFQQRVVARHELGPEVAEGTRKSFDQLRTVYGYGVLCYDIYTMVNDRALLVFEHALRDRFIEFHQGQVTFVHHKTGETRRITGDRYEQVHEFAAKNGRFQLQVGDGPGTLKFNAMLADLVAWARALGFLRGQRNRMTEKVIARLRNNAAHPSAYELRMPVDAAATISDLAEIINHLWGSATPGGRLYPAPVERGIVALTWDDTGGQVMSWPITAEPGPDDGEASPGGPDPGGWTWVLVRGVAEDWDLLHFDARYETARYPADWLWGPGTAQGAFDWLSRHRPAGDEVDILDRHFLLRYHDRRLYLPQRPEIMAASADQPGTWFLIRADAPDQAFNHQRQVLAGGYSCSPAGACACCPVETIGTGSWDDMMGMLAARGLTPQPREVPDVRVPSRMGWPRCNRILDGSWDIPQEEF